MAWSCYLGVTRAAAILRSGSEVPDRIRGEEVPGGTAAPGRCPDQHGGRGPRRQRRSGCRRLRRGGPAPRPRGRLPRADGHRLPARGPRVQALLPGRQPRHGAAPRARVRRHRGRGRLRGPDPGGPGQRGRPLRPWPRARRLPQDPAAQLRRVRRGALLRPRRRAAAGHLRRRPGGGRHLRGPVVPVGAAGAEVVVSLNAFPYRLEKGDRLAPMLATRAADHGAHLFWVNQVGGQDELVFDGQSTYVDPQGRTLARAGAFDEELLLVDLTLEEGATARLADRPRRAPAADAEPALPVRRVQVRDTLPDPGPPLPQRLATPLGAAEEVYRALVTATRDYVAKNDFRSVLVGLSGGIDSSLVAAVACDALGRDRVTGVAMPSAYSSAGSLGDARALAANLGIRLLELPIVEPVEAFLGVLKEPFAGTEEGVAEENLQSRSRGVLLMGLSNKFGSLLLNTGNKSELAVGYCTLYGDMAGGFGVIKDVPKTLVYELARWRNEAGVVIPQSVLDKPPSAELRPGQLDTDSLPPYEVLDPVLEGYVEDDLSADELVTQGFDREVVEKVVRLVDGAEYKRRQAPPGPKVTGRAFGKDRRLPITNRFHGRTGPAR